MHLQGSLHLQLLGTVGPACVVHHTPWLEGIHLSNWQGLGSVACQMGAAHTSLHLLGECSPAGHRVGTIGRLSPAVTGLNGLVGIDPR